MRPPAPLTSLSGASLGVETCTNHVRGQGLHQGSHIIHEGQLVIIIEFLEERQPGMDPELATGLILRLDLVHFIWQ